MWCGADTSLLQTWALAVCNSELRGPLEWPNRLFGAKWCQPRFVASPWRNPSMGSEELTADPLTTSGPAVTLNFALIVCFTNLAL